MTEQQPYNFPDWLADVPLDIPEQATLPLGESGKTIQTRFLMEALQIDVGTTVGSFAIAPQLADQIAQMTENPSWRNLPPEPTHVSRKAEDEWHITVGEVTERFTHQGILDALKKSLLTDTEDEK